MIRTRPLVLACAIAALLTRVPAGADQPKEQKQRCPYAGTYTGTYTASNANAGDREGETTIKIDDDGKVTGEGNAKGSDAKVKITGAILKDNKAVLIYEEAGGNKSNAYGTISRTAKGGITGTLIQRFGATAIDFMEFDVNPKAK